MSSWKSLLVAGAAVMLVGAGCQSSGGSMTTEQTGTEPSKTAPAMANIQAMSGYKVYQNATEKFAIQYPEGWEMREGSFGTLVSFLSPLANKDDQFSENVNVVSEVIGDQNITLEQYYKVSEENLKKYFSDFKLVKNEATTFAGLPGRTVIYTATQGQLKLRTTQIFTIKDKKSYIITLTNTQSQPTMYYDQMLKSAQSFQFLP